VSTQLFESAVQRLDAGSADISDLFGGLSPVAQRTARRAPGYGARLLEAELFTQEIMRGRRPLSHFSEAMATSDFPLLFADSLDRKLYAAYESIKPTWRNYCRPETVNDFRAVKRFATSGIRGRLAKVGELAPHERRSQTEAKYEYGVERYEAGFGLSWEALINDDLDAFGRLPEDLAASVIDTEEAFAASLFADASGPHATHYTAGNLNLLTGNPALTRTSLQSALTILRKRRDDRGNPTSVTAVELVVGPGLEQVANEIVGATQYRSVGANGDVTIITGNGISANLRVSCNTWIPAIATTANADTSWWLFANPNGARPACVVGHLRGYEAPALYEKVPDMRRIGGGLEMVSFDSAASEKKVMAVLGGVFADVRMTVASNGSGA
jgi:hypothetical protein